MPYELNEIKQVMLGRDADLYTDSQFLEKYNCKNLQEFFQLVWDTPDPCYFLWVTNQQLRELKGNPLYKFSNLSLIRVDINTFYRCQTDKQRLIVNGESGFKVKKINDTLTIW